MTEPSHAVFLSYASQDQEAAQRICEVLRAAGIEVWFDQSALRGGDVWDQTIRKQIKTCVLFIPVISRHTHERDEGYFRLEWKLAVERSHLMTHDKTFLLPIVIDDTREDDERVPDRFRDVHWTRLPGGETPPAFVERVRRLVSPEASHGPTTAQLRADQVHPAATTPHRPVQSFWRSKSALPVIAAVVLAGGVAYFAIDKFWTTKRPASPPAAPASAAQAAFAPPPHSIAVLPFVNISGDKEQEYFSDGLTEELLNSLSRINELQVAARTSSFSFKGKDSDMGAIARKLNVGAILEGSVRRAGHTIRVTAQLNNAVTGFHLWSETYDRDVGDVLKLQTEIATAVTSALKVTLLGNVAARVEVGGTRNPAAFDAYLRALNDYFSAKSGRDLRPAIAGYTEAIRLDPSYARGYAARSLALSNVADWATGSAVQNYLKLAQADADRAIALSPELAEGHLALAGLADHRLEFTRAGQQYQRALALAPGNARLLRNYGVFAAKMGQAEAGVAAAQRAVVLDPLNPSNHLALGESLFYSRRYAEAIAAYKDAAVVAPNNAALNSVANTGMGFSYYLSGDLQSARAACESGDEIDGPVCLAMTDDKLGLHADARVMLEKLRGKWGDAAPVDYAMIYAQWGDTARALDWLETAMRQHKFLLGYVRTVELFDPLRKEPRFQAIERALKFPND